MILRFVSGDYSEDFELYGAQAESTVGLFDALRSAILDLTADAVVMASSVPSITAALKAAKKGVERQAAYEKQLAASRSFAGVETNVYLVRDGKKAPQVLFLSFPTGMKDAAERIVSETAVFAADLASVYRPTFAAYEMLSELDSGALMLPNAKATEGAEEVDLEALIDEVEKDEAAKLRAVEKEKAKGSKKKTGT
jgi:hypothetical protein